MLACIDCNKRKADRTPEQARMKLHRRAGAAGLEAALRTDERADRELVEVHQRGVLERPAGELSLFE